MSGNRPSREQMLRDLREAGVVASDPSMPSRAQMLRDLRQKELAEADFADYVHTALMPFDYLPGIARTGVYSTAQVSSNLMRRLHNFFKDDQLPLREVVKPEDIDQTLRGNAPPSSTYLERLGLPPGASGLLGFGSDLALGGVSGSLLGPLGRGTGMLAQAAKGAAPVVTKPISTGLSKLGSKIYSNAPAMKAVDSVLSRYRKTPLSPTLMKEGVWGQGTSIATQAKKLSDIAGSERDALLQMADVAGAEANMKRAMTPIQSYIQRLEKEADPGKADYLKALKEKVKGYLDRGAQPEQVIQTETQLPLVNAKGQPITITNTKVIPATQNPKASEASSFASTLYNQVPENAYDKFAHTAYGTRGNKMLAYGLKKEARAAAEGASPGLGEAIKSKDQLWGQYLTAAKTLNREGIKDLNKNAFTSVDGILLGMLKQHPKIAAFKKGADLAKGNLLRTGAGVALDRVSQLPALDQVVLRGLMNATYKDENEAPWERVMRDFYNGP